MLWITTSRRCGGPKRGGTGGGYELTNPDYVDHRIARMCREFKTLQTDYDRSTYLSGLSRRDAQEVQDRAQGKLSE